MSYQDLLNELHKSEPQPNPRYYTLIATNMELIIRQCSLTSQVIVADQLGMSTSKLSGYIVMFKELINNNVTLNTLEDK